MERPWILAAVGAVALAAAAVWMGDGPGPPPLVGVADPVSPTEVTIHVSGAVVRPGLVTVAEGSRVADAIVAAGGATADADLSALNLAGPVGDGQMLSVPTYGAESPTAGADGTIRINTADVGQMQDLPGVGPVLAARIVAHRDTNGPFVSVEDLLDVSGIGEGKLAALRDSVQVP